MRTFTIVPSFEGESAYFELPDIGFQGDHLSFAILFNLTELTEHWQNIIPSMIVTDSKGDTYIAPYTSWDSENHIFTWNISSTETTYDGNLMCQLKCTSADDPETIVCMSRICQTKVYPSLEAASDPPEAFQTWLDTLVRLGAEIFADADQVAQNTEASETNARTAVDAANTAVAAKNDAISAKDTAVQKASDAADAQAEAERAQTRAQNAADDAESAKTDAISAKASVEDALDDLDEKVEEIEIAKSTAVDAATHAQGYSNDANTAKEAAINAANVAVVAKGDSQVAQSRAEQAEDAARRAQTKSEDAQAAAETAQGLAEDAQDAAETAQGLAEDAQAASERARDTAIDNSELAKKWAIGVDKNNAPVSSGDPTYQNSAKYWSGVSEAAKQAIFEAPVSTAYYTPSDESITLVLGAEAMINQQGV